MCDTPARQSQHAHTANAARRNKTQCPAQKVINGHEKKSKTEMRKTYFAENLHLPAPRLTFAAVT